MAFTSQALAGGQLQLADMRRRLKAIFIGSVGNLVEWYDFYAYAAFALYFASSFFPHDDVWLCSSSMPPSCLPSASSCVLSGDGSSGTSPIITVDATR